MTWGAIVAGGASLLGSALSSRSGSKAADKEAAGYQAGIDEQRRQFDTIMSMLAPQRQFGVNALDRLNRVFGAGGITPGGATPGYGGPTSQIGSTGIGVNGTGGVTQGAVAGGAVTGGDAFRQLFGGRQVTPTAPAAGGAGAIGGGGNPLTAQAQGAPDMSGFFTSPNYNFTRGEGMRGIENSFAARGGAASGNALRALTEFNSNLASGQFNNFVNQNLAMAGLGGAATGDAANAAQYTGGNVANLLGQQGQARGSGVAARGNAVTGGLNDLASIYGIWSRGGFGGGGGSTPPFAGGGW